MLCFKPYLIKTLGKLEMVYDNVIIFYEVNVFNNFAHSTLSVHLVLLWWTTVRVSK